MIGIVNEYHLEISYDQTWSEAYVIERFYEIGTKDSYELKEGCE